MPIDPLRLAAGVASGVGPALAQASPESRHVGPRGDHLDHLGFHEQAGPSDREPDDYSDHPDYPRQQAGRVTPVTDGGLAMYDHLEPVVAIYRAWTEPGPYPEYHAKMRNQVHALMPLLARALDRWEREVNG